MVSNCKLALFWFYFVVVESDFKEFGRNIGPPNWLQPPSPSPSPVRQSLLCASTEGVFRVGAFPFRTEVWLGGRDDDAEQEAAMNADGSTDRLIAEVKGRLAALGPLIMVDHPGACHPRDLELQS